MDCTCDYILPTQDDWEPHYANCKCVWNKREQTEYPKNADGTLRLQNKYLKNLDQDFLYHLGFDTQSNDLEAMFGDIKFVCMGGTKYRMKEVAKYMSQLLDISCDLKNLAKEGHRFAMYKVGPVLCLSHGIGISSIMVILEEVLKMLYYAKAKDPIIFRLGTSGGINVPPGTVVISSSCVNDTLEPYYELAILGKVRKFPATLDKRLNQELYSLANCEDFMTTLGTTLSCYDFYQGEARIDGAFCVYTEADRKEFLRGLLEMGVKNVEMECVALAALARQLGVRAASVCVTFLDRLHGDQVTVDPKILSEWQKRPAIVVGKYIQKYLKKC